MPDEKSEKTPTKTQRQKTREVFAKNLILFCRKMWPLIFRKKSPPFHYEIAAHLIDPSIKKIVIQAPRDFAKSMVVAVGYVMFHIFFSDYIRLRKRQPKFVVIGSKTQRHSKNILETIQMILDESKMLRWLFGDYGEATAVRWTGEELILKDKTVLVARGASQALRGLNKFGRRPTLAVWDDPEDEKNTRTKESMEGNLRVLLAGIVKMMDREFGDKVIVIGTPVCEGCMVEKLTGFAERKPDPIRDDDGNVVAETGWISLHYSGIVLEEGQELKDGKSLWPERWPLETLLAEYEENVTNHTESIFWAETMCMIVPDGKRLFARYGYYRGKLEIKNGKHFVIVTHRGLQSEDPFERRSSLKELDEPEVVPINLFMGVDPARSTKIRADASAIMEGGLSSTGDWLMLPYFLDRVSALTLAKRIEERAHAHAPLRIRIENVAYQEMLREYMAMRVRGVAPDKDSASNERKEMRLEGLSLDFEDGRMWLQPGMNQLESEMRSFGAGREHDDTLDGMWYMKRRTWRPNHGIEEYRYVAPKNSKHAPDRSEHGWMGVT